MEMEEGKRGRRKEEESDPCENPSLDITIRP